MSTLTPARFTLDAPRALADPGTSRSATARRYPALCLRCSSAAPEGPSSDEVGYTLANVPLQATPGRCNQTLPPLTPPQPARMLKFAAANQHSACHMSRVLCLAYHRFGRCLLPLYLCYALVAGPLASRAHQHAARAGAASCQTHHGQPHGHAPEAAPGISSWFGHPGGAGAPHDEANCTLCHFLSECSLADMGGQSAGHVCPASQLAALAKQALPDRLPSAAWPRAPPA